MSLKKMYIFYYIIFFKFFFQGTYVFSRTLPDGFCLDALFVPLTSCRLCTNRRCRSLKDQARFRKLKCLSVFAQPLNITVYDILLSKYLNIVND